MFSLRGQCMKVREPAAKLPCREAPFQQKHALNYDLQIIPRHSQTSAVVAVRCQFCVCFGREVAKKKSATSLTIECPPFRTGNYRQHHRINYKTTRANYEELSHAEKPRFFDVPVKHAESFCHYPENRAEAKRFVN